MSVSSSSSNTSTEVINSYDLDPIEEFQQLYGVIYQYRIGEIYTLLYKVMKWSNIEIIRLFEALRDEYDDEKACNDDYEVRRSIQTSIDHINSFIELLEYDLVK